MNTLRAETCLQEKAHFRGSHDEQGNMFEDAVGRSEAAHSGRIACCAGVPPEEVRAFRLFFLLRETCTSLFDNHALVSVH